MRIAKNWKEFEVIDTSDGEKLERWGDVTLARPDPQIIWKTPKDKAWKNADARYVRSTKGGGEWTQNNIKSEFWTINYGKLKFKISPTGFKHTGLFPEQAVNWDFIDEKIRTAGREISVLNLFAYTGGATLAAANAGARVCHVDASKGMVKWAKENAELSKLSDKPIRWIVDDCLKFIEREARRGNKYDAIIMDPPSYGRGPNGEIWKLEDSVFELVSACTEILSDNPLFFILNSYTTGLSPSVMEYLLGVTVGKKFSGEVSSSEIGLPVKKSNFVLPCGSTAIWQSK
ncbi:MAG: class I SAM-dependent methyltransferase [Oscillospiraceae bacterium]